MTWRYIIYIKNTFWDKMYKSDGITDDKKKIEAKTKCLVDINNFLAGEENAGKAIV